MAMTPEQMQTQVERLEAGFWKWADSLSPEERREALELGHSVSPMCEDDARKRLKDVAFGKRLSTMDIAEGDRKYAEHLGLTLIPHRQSAGRWIAASTGLDAVRLAHCLDYGGPVDVGLALGYPREDILAFVDARGERAAVSE